jgi:hypothetical protein
LVIGEPKLKNTEDQDVMKIVKNVVSFAMLSAAATAPAANAAATNAPNVIPWNQIGAKAGAD